jgi:hypothetical protein
VADGATLPLHPTVAYYTVDKRRLDKINSDRKTAPRKITATLNGKPVKLLTHDVRMRHHVVRFMQVDSHQPGQLKLAVPDPAAPSSVEYTLSAEGKPVAATAVVSRYHQERSRMAVSFRDALAIRIDVPVLSFSVQWRRDGEDRWRLLEMPAVQHHGDSTALIGQTECWDDEVPLEILERGIELSLKARLPDGRTVPVGGLTSPVTLPPLASLERLAK